MTKEEKISIIITTYNKAKFIKKTLYSCLIQDYKNYEIIVVDTGSTDKTVKIIKSLKKKRIKKIFLKRKFKTSPLNQIYAISCGLKASKGKIICLLDGDDIFKKHKLFEINKIFRSFKKLSFLQDVIKIKKKKKIINYNINKRFNLIDIWPKFYPTSTFSIRKKDLVNFFQIDRNDYNLLEIDLKLFFYSKFKLKNHYILNKNLTTYIEDIHGISSKFRRFNYDWFLKRFQAHEYLRHITSKKNYPYYIDYILTSVFLKFMSLIRFN